MYFCLLSFCPSFFLSLLCSLIVSFIVGCVCLSFFLRPVVGVVRFLSFCMFSCALASCCCSCRGGGGFFAWVVMYVAVSVSFFCFALLQRKPERCPLVHALLASSSLCPVLLLLVHVLVLCCVCLFLMHVHAQRRRPLGLSFTTSCVAALLSQDSRRSGPDLPCLGSWYPRHG